MSSFLEHMSLRCKERLAQLAEPRLLGAGEVLIRRGERSADFFRVERGSLEVVDSGSRPVVVLDVLGPGTFVGEMSFLSQAPRSADVRAVGESVVLCWKAELLREELEQNAELATAFYRSAALLLSHRLGNINRAATGGALIATANGTTDVGGARALADRLKARLLELEGVVREPGGLERAQQEMSGLSEELLGAGRRLFSSLSESEREAAGKVLRDELQPYLLRSRTGRLCSEAGGGRAQVLAHVELGDARGTDVLGRLLDREILLLPTASGLRDRVPAMAAAALEALPRRRARLLSLPVGAGTTIARLVPMMATHGGEISAADGDREALSSLNSGGPAGTTKVRLRLIHEDIGLLAVRGSETFFGPQDVILLDGLVEYLPSRALAFVLMNLRKSLASGGSLVLSTLLPTQDHFLFDHLLGWRTLRRRPVELLDLLSSVGLLQAQVVYESGAAAVIRGIEPGQG